MAVSQWRGNLAVRLGRIIVTFALLVGVVYFVAAHFLAWRWATRPFLGMLLEPTLVLSPLQAPGWARLQFDPPLEQPDRLVAVDLQPVGSSDDIQAVLARHAVGDTVWVMVERPNGEVREEQITLTAFPMRDLFSFHLIPYLLGLAYLGFGIWVYWVQGWGPAGQVFASLCVAFALVLAGIFDLSTTHRLVILWSAALSFTAATVMHLALVFPQEPRFVQRVPVLRLLPYLPAILLAFRSALADYDTAHPWSYITWWRMSYLFLAIGILFFVGMLIYRMVRPSSPLVRQQSRVILLGAALSFLPVIPWLLINFFGTPAPFLTLVYVPLFAFFPLSIAYAILRYRLMDVDQLLSRGLAYGALSFLIVAAYFAITNGLSHFFAVQSSDPVLLSLFVLSLVLLFNPLRNYAQKLVDRAFFREEEDYRVTLYESGRELSQTLDLNEVLNMVGEQVEEALQPRQQWICLYDEERGGYVGYAVGGERRGNGPVSPAFLFPDGHLAAWLRGHKEPLYLLTETALPLVLGDEWPQVNALGAVLYVPLRAEGEMIGWLALGPRQNGQPYHYDDLAFISALAERSALALSNARRFASMQRQLSRAVADSRRMENVFNSIASGVITADVQDRVTLFNRAAETILNIPAAEVIGRPYQRVLWALGGDLQHVAQSVKKGEIPVLTYEVQPQVGGRGTLWLRVNISPLKDIRGVTSGVAIVVDDMTERRKLEAHARHIREAFERYVSPAVVEQLLYHPNQVRLGGERQEVTSFYADIRGFTAFSEKTTPEFQIKVLNKHLTLAAAAILAHEGTLDKFVGDGAMAIFNAPVSQADHTMRAVRAALATQEAVREHHLHVDEGEQLHFGIGITVGQAVVGNIGSAMLHNFTAIGDCVNLSARLSSIAKPDQILISAEAYERVKEQIEARFVGYIQVRGHSQPDPIYEVLGLKEESE